MRFEFVDYLLRQFRRFSLLTGTSPGEFHSHPLLDAEVYDYVVVVCMGKSEGKYLKEWVEHNRRYSIK